MDLVLQICKIISTGELNDKDFCLATMLEQQTKRIAKKQKSMQNFEKLVGDHSFSPQNFF